MMKRLLAVSLAVVLLSGCASIMRENTQPISVVAMHNDRLDPAALCTIKNSKGSWVSSGNGHVNVNKAGSDLVVECKNDKEMTIGSASAESSVAARYVVANFFIFDLCTISCIVDFSSGSIYDYPTQVKVPMLP